MSRRKYYAYYWNSFSNTYELYYSDGSLPVRDDFERITRKEAIRLCVAEKERRRADPAFSGYAATTILPYEYVYDSEGNVINDAPIWCGPDYVLDGYVWERK